MSWKLLYLLPNLNVQDPFDADYWKLMRVLMFLAVILLLAIAPLSPATNDRQSDKRVLTQETNSLSDVDLASIVLQSGDLPIGYSAGKTEHSEPGAFKKLPKTKYVVHQPIKKKKEIIGGTTIFFYTENMETNLAYEAMLEVLGEPGRPGSNIQHVVGIGERAVLAIFNMAFAVDGVTVSRHEYREFIFVRCHAVVNIRLDDPNAILSYAQKLDQRILDSLCRIQTSRSVDRQQAEEEIRIIRSRIQDWGLADRYKIDDEKALEDVILFIHDPVTHFDSIKDIHRLWNYIGMYDHVMKGSNGSTADYFLNHLREISVNIDAKKIEVITYLLHDHHPDGVYMELLVELYIGLFEMSPGQFVNNLKTRQDWKSVIERLSIGNYETMKAGLKKLGDSKFERELKEYWAECEKRWARMN